MNEEEKITLKKNVRSVIEECSKKQIMNYFSCFALSTFYLLTQHNFFWYALLPPENLKIFGLIKLFFGILSGGKVNFIATD